MPRKSNPKCIVNYSLVAGAISTCVTADQFAAAIRDGYAVPDETHRKRARVKPRYGLYIDHATGRPAFIVREMPEYDWHLRKLRSVFYLLLRQAIYAGEANSLLHDINFQVYRKVRI